MQRLLKFAFSTLLLVCAPAFSQAADPRDAKDLPGASANALDPGLIFGPLDDGGMFQPFNQFTHIFDHLFSANSDTPSNRPKKNKNGCPDTGADPVILSTGTKVETAVDFSIPGEFGLRFERFYNSSGIFGNDRHPWTTSFDYFLDFYWCGSIQCGSFLVVRPDGSSLQFKTVAKQSQTGLTPIPEIGGGGLATLVRNEADGSYTLHDEDGTTQVYGSATGTIGPSILSITDASGIGWTFSYAGGLVGRVARVTHTNGQSISFAYSLLNGSGSAALQMTVIDPAGNNYVYTLDNNQNYLQATLPGAPATVYNYKYNSQGYLAEIDVNATPYAFTTYDGSGRAIATYLADGSQQYSIAYGSTGTGPTTSITNPLGHVATSQYNSQLQLLGISGTAVSTCGATANARSYDGNGNLAGTIDNNGNVHSYTYAANGQLQTETEAFGTSQARTTDYVWDANVQLNRPLSVTVEGWKRTSYTYNAQNRLASQTVTNLSSNGLANQSLSTSYNYTLYANGIVHTMTVSRPSPGGSDTDTYTYDSVGNLASLSNGLGQATTYSNYNGLGEVGHVVGPNGDATDYTYDARGRVITKTTYPNGAAATWTNTYDGFGLLSSQSAPDGQMTTWGRDLYMRVTSITHNDKDGTSTETFSYDANGDVLEHVVARGSALGIDEIFHYDALGRLYQKAGQHGQLLTYSYDGNGNVLSTANAVGHWLNIQYDALNRVAKSTESGGATPVPAPTAVPTVNAPSNSTTGTYTVSWNSVPWGMTYTLQELSGGTWNTVQTGGALSWTALSKASGPYGYRVQACNGVGCSNWSLSATVIVLVPPSAPIISAPAGSTTGEYTVNWSSVATADSYTLQEQVNGGAWTTVQSNSLALWWPAHSKGSNTYGYKVQACNSTGCGAWSSAVTVTVLLPPAVPTLTAPTSSTNGNYSVSWSGVATASSYTLQESTNGGSSWTTVQSGGALSWSAAGKASNTYDYQIQACNASGCSQWSSLAAVTVLLPPSAPTLSTPATNANGNYSVSWTSVSTATSYTLQERVGGGAWATVQNGNGLSWSASGKTNNTYGYQVQACNASGCGAWSTVSTTTVLFPPGVPMLVVPATSGTGTYTVSWANVATATSYTLQQRANGGGWTTVQTSAALSFAATSLGNGSYDYQAQACNASGCSTWSALATTVVLHAPTSAPTITTPSTNITGSYTVSWSSVATASSYILLEQANGAAWTMVQTAGTLSWTAGGHVSGTYGYQVQACNNGGCGPVSSTATTSVLLAPSTAPILSASTFDPNGPYNGLTQFGQYMVVWTPVATASSYALQESTDGGSNWATVQSGVATTWTPQTITTGTRTYRAQACNSTGCGPWSLTFDVSIPGAGAPTITGPMISSTGGYAVTWTALSGVTSYNLQEMATPYGGVMYLPPPVATWTTVQAGSATSWTPTPKAYDGYYAYRVQACTGSVCGPWSPTIQTTVLFLPQAPTGLNVTSSRPSTGQVSLSWSTDPVPRVTYHVQESDAVNGIVDFYDGTSPGVNGSVSVTGVASFQVQTCDDAGCSQWSAPVNITLSSGE